MSGCGTTRAIYGVPQAPWEQMSPTERQAARDRFKQQEEINARTREQAKQQALRAREKAEELVKLCHPEAMSDSSKCQVITRQKRGF